MAPTYHLWLKPSGRAYELLAAAIQTLARQLQAPVFEPHVTLLGRLIGTEHELLAQAEQLAEKLRPFHIVLTEPSYREEYFQCLFLKVKETPSILNAHTAASQLFSHEHGSAYMPHLSLVYGLYPQELKQEVIAGLSPDLRMTFDTTVLCLVRADSHDPKDWHELCAVRLGEPRASEEQWSR
ncbi:MAG: hypothetical protein C4293_08000 [Nitrospiraceae bacterium]